MKVKDILKTLEDEEDKVNFVYGDGKVFFGWILERKDMSFLVRWSPSPFYSQAMGTKEMAPPDEWIDFMDIDINSLQWIFNNNNKRTSGNKKWWKLCTALRSLPCR